MKTSAPAVSILPQQLTGRLYVVDQAIAAADDDGPGSPERPFRTIAPAAARAVAGDTVLVHEGVYRECIAPANSGTAARPLVFRAAPGHRVIVTGSEVFKPTWEAVPGNTRVFTAPLDVAAFGGFNPFARQIRPSRGGGRQGMLILDGKPLREVLTFQALLKEPGTWLTANGMDLVLHLPEGLDDPAKGQFEISVRRRCFAPVRRGMNWIHVIGFVFEHAANDVSLPQVGALSCRSGREWLIQDNIIRYNKTLGIDCGDEGGVSMLPDDTHRDDRYEIGGMRGPWPEPRKISGGHRIVGNHVYGNGQCGIAGLNSDATVCIGNLVEGNAHDIPGFESAGIKFHGLLSGRVEGNVVRDNGAFGIWLDCGNMGSRVTGNVVSRNNAAGIFLEVSDGPTRVDNNIVFANAGDGIYMHDNSEATIDHNLVFDNQHFGIYAHIVTDREMANYSYATGRVVAQQCGCWGHRLFDNLLIRNHAGEISLPAPSSRVYGNTSDANILTAAQGREVLFVVNIKNGEKHNADQAMSAMQQTFEKTGDPGLAATAIHVFQDKGTALSLKQWQALNGMDRNSLAIPAIAMPLVTGDAVRLTLPSDFVWPKPVLAAPTVAPLPPADTLGVIERLSGGEANLPLVPTKMLP